MLGVRWTIGDVNRRGFDALRLSIWGAWKLFGRLARYRVFVNSVPMERVRALTGEVPPAVEWQSVGRDLPAYLASSLDSRMAEGVAWKLVPLRAFPDHHELALDNDVVLWKTPTALRDWLHGKVPFLLAEDVRPAFGRFADLCGERALNAGIRGLPPGFDFDAALRDMLRRRPGPLASELDEQGLQAAALLQAGAVGVVPMDEVTICSPFPPHRPHLGTAGAHFVGLNTRSLGFEYEGRAAEQVRAEHWDQRVTEVARRVGIVPELTVRHCRRSDLRQLEWSEALRADRAIIEHVFFARACQGDTAMLVAEVAGTLVGQTWIDFARKPGVAILWALRSGPSGVGAASAPRSCARPSTSSSAPACAWSSSRSPRTTTARTACTSSSATRTRASSTRCIRSRASRPACATSSCGAGWRPGEPAGRVRSHERRPSVSERYTIEDAARGNVPGSAVRSPGPRLALRKPDPLHSRLSRTDREG